MQLKRLQLFGFKTFAEKTDIEIGSGLTAIVGPNGSGKSNIVDALLWVLGEQNPRLLRGSAAQDVIFAGTDRRKPLGMAEVKLTIDNTDGALPVQFTEVVVTRRIYRSGESQYLLNNSPCRLKDIVELFLDTGVGKGAYAFVSQQEIDAVLSARAEDRRELFEEAAGIKKYRVKKREALRKLETAQANLNRVGDILAEIETQREPMERQAIAARRYTLLQERLHEIEVGLLVAELQKADYELHAGRTERDADQAQVLTIDAELARLERASAETGERLAHAEAELESLRLTRQTCLSAVERATSHLTLLSERGRTAHQMRDQITQELRAIGERMDSLEANLEANTRERAEVERAETEQRDEWAARRSSLAELEAALREAMREAETRQSERLRSARQRAAQEAALQAARERMQDLESRAERLRREIAELETVIQELEGRAGEARSAAARIRDEMGELQTERQSLQAQRAGLIDQQARGRPALDAAHRSLAEQSSRLSTLTELQESHEGFYQGVRALLNAARRGAVTGHYKAVVDLLTVSEPYRVAIEVALGGSLQDIVTLTEAEAKAGIDWLKQNRAGRATFLALPLLRSSSRLEPPRSGPDSRIENALDLVGCDDAYVPALQLLLARVLVAPTMEDAIGVSRRASGWSKIVTLGGELLSPGGALTGGSLQGRGAHLVGRKGEIDDLKAKVPALREEVARAAEDLERQQQAMARLDTELGELARRESALAARAAAEESGAASAERELARLVRDRVERVQSAERLAAQMESLRTEIAELAATVAAQSVENESAEGAHAALNEQTRALAEQRDACRAAAVAVEVEVSRLREQREGLTRALASDRATLAGLEQQRVQKSSQRGAAETTGAEAELERERLERELEEAKSSLSAAEQHVNAAAERRQALLGENFATTASFRERTQQRSTVAASLHDTELRLARLEVQITQASDRLQEEYGLSRDEALSRPEETSIDRNTAIEVSRLRRELRAMGQVNIGAVAEYERLTERYDYLTSQQADLTESRGALLKTIEEIDDSTRGVFMETFETVRTEFDRLFRRLFEGGSTKLVLTRPDDLLETGIDVIAQPPGKKPQHLSLLSGGERALTATALLFSFLVVRPSPFVLLDEVDAPLDGANVEKFTHLVREFSERSQFLLITHNPTTMEAAPCWYGVTMREPGISSIISYRAPQETVETTETTAVALA